MKTVIVKSQAEWDSLPAAFDEFTIVEIRSTELIRIKSNPESSGVVARGSSRVEAWGSSRVVARESSSVVARGLSRVVAWGSSRVEAWGSSSVEAWGSSRVVARESSSVVAWESSSVVAWGSSRVAAWGLSRVVARGSSRVEAWGLSSVDCHDYSFVFVMASSVLIKRLLDYTVASLRGVKCKIVKKAKTATVVHAKEIKHNAKDFFDRCDSDKKGTVLLWKSVNPSNGCDFRTGTIKYEGVVECPDFDPDPNRECGGGLHLSPTMVDALSYNQGKLLQCRVSVKDIVVNPNDLTKVRCRRVEVIG